jgi:hypothetical protein
VINTSFRRALWADVLYACDETWWRAYFPEVARTFQGEKWTVNERVRDAFHINWIFGVDQAGLSKDPTLISQGKNSGYQAMGLAYLFGATRLLLLGFDFQKSGNRSHWHGDHPPGLGNASFYPGWVNAMNALAIDLKREGIEVINCSRATAIQCFPRSTIQEVL